MSRKRIFVCHNGEAIKNKKNTFLHPKKLKSFGCQFNQIGIITLLSAIELLVEAKINRTFFTIVGADGDIKAKNY